MTRNRLIVVGIAAAIILAAVTFPLWRPLFVNDVVDEAFPALTEPQRDAVRAMPADQRSLLVQMAEENSEMASDTALAMMEDDTSVAESMPADPVLLGSGSFRGFDAVHNGEGTAAIYELADGSRVLRLEDFRVNNGPDLHVILASSAPTTTFERPDAGYIDLGSLKGNVGNQNYEIPADVDLAAFGAVIIYCLPFHVNFSAAALS
jgi:hypothetical protein